ncbi:MAG: hypothetical protein Fur0037_18960 [Planctomycetota bacterium]
MLLVEDDPVTAEVFARAFAQEGLQVRVARDGNQAMHALRDRLPDILVLDLGLPTLPGIDVLTRLRSAGHDSIPVLVVSGTPPGATAVREDMLRPGAWILKPVRPGDLVAAARSLL